VFVFEGVCASVGDRHSKRRLFQDLSLTLPGNRHLAILGPAGSGKSTLIKLLAGIEQPDRGTIRCHTRVSFPLGYGRGLKHQMSARHNLSHAARIYGARVEEVVDFVERVLDWGRDFDEPLRSLPPQQSACFRYAMSYAIPFDTYLIDGPVSIGSPAFRDKCQAMFEARAATSGMIMTARDVRTARRHCDLGALIHDGGIVLYQDFEEAAAALLELEADAAGREEPADLQDAYSAKPG
jgi:capsular polysaccharide transport system ATP-binding protein